MTGSTALRMVRHGLHLATATAAFWLVWALVADPASADNCSVFTDCFNQSNSAAEAAFGLTLLAGLSLVIDFIPIVGDAKGIVEGFTGRDLLTGEELSDFERALGFIPFLPVADALRGARHLDDLAGLGRHGDDLLGVGRGSDAWGGAGRTGDGLTDVGRHAPPPGRGPTAPTAGDVLSHPTARQGRVDELVDAYGSAGSGARRTISEELGELGGMSALERAAGRQLDLLRPGSLDEVTGYADMVVDGQAWPSAVAFRGRNVTNLAWFDGDTMRIIEAKGGSGSYGDRFSSIANDGTTRISQTDADYPRDVALDMRRSGIQDGRNEIGQAILDAYETGDVHYSGVRTGPRSGILEGRPTTIVEHVFLEPS